MVIAAPSPMPRPPPVTSAICPASAVREIPNPLDQVPVDGVHGAVGLPSRDMETTATLFAKEWWTDRNRGPACPRGEPVGTR